MPYKRKSRRSEDHQSVNVEDLLGEGTDVGHRNEEPSIQRSRASIPQDDPHAFEGKNFKILCPCNTCQWLQPPCSRLYTTVQKHIKLRGMGTILKVILSILIPFHL